MARRLIAVRDNEPGAGAMGVSVVRTKLLAFALSGFMAGVAGVCLAFALERIKPGDFSPTTAHRGAPSCCWSGWSGTS